MRVIIHNYIQVSKTGENAPWVLVEPLNYTIQDGFDSWVDIVPAGFETDLASVPRLPLAFWLTGATANRPAIIHDWLCVLLDKGKQTKFGKKLTWAWAAKVFLAAMKAEGVPGWRRYAMWSAVRVHGFFRAAPSS